jgi:hypothetical protein
VNILQAMSDERAFGSFFVGPSWAFWRVVLRVLFGLPLSAEEQAVALRHTGRSKPFTKPLRELWLAIGRRGGKSRVCALIAVFVACVLDHSASLVPGETAVVLLCAPSQRQARVLLGYVLAFLHAVPILSRLVVRETDYAVELNNGITIEVRSSNFKTVRGFTVVAAIVDEVAFLPADDSVIPDTELLNSIRPAMASVPDSLLILSSTPHARAGELYKAHGKHFANDESSVAFFNATTLTANPGLDAGVVLRAFEDDEAVALSEYGRDGFVAFRSDVENFISQEMLEMSVDRDRPLVLLPVSEVAA